MSEVLQHGIDQIDQWIKFEAHKFNSQELVISFGNDHVGTLTITFPIAQKHNSYTLVLNDGRKILFPWSSSFLMEKRELTIDVDDLGIVSLKSTKSLDCSFRPIPPQDNASPQFSLKYGLIKKSRAGANDSFVHEIGGGQIAMSTVRSPLHEFNDEDSIGFRIGEDGDSFRMVVVDGMGGCPFADYAASLVTESMLRANCSLLEAAERASEDLKFFGSTFKDVAPNAVVAAIDVKNDQLNLVNKGDVKIYVVRDGKVFYETKPHNRAQKLHTLFDGGGWNAIYTWLRSKKGLEGRNDRQLEFLVINNYPDLLSAPTNAVVSRLACDTHKITLEKGDRVVIVSDGVPLDAEEIAKSVSGSSAEEGLLKIHAGIEELKRQDCYYRSIGDTRIKIPFPHDDVSVAVHAYD